jgi:S-adenosylmethionine hydrolase
MSGRILTFTSDFGLADWFVGVVHGVLHERCPAARIVDLTHAIPPGDIARAAFVVGAAAPDLPAGTVHLAVVDPGVGTERRALAVSSRGQWFVGPDNGVLEWALAETSAEVRALENSEFFRTPVSRTFHGRDVFAPVAGALACGVEFAKLGARVTDAVRLPRQTPRLRDSSADPASAGTVAPRILAGEIMYIDRFGNALTSIDEASIAGTFAGVPERELEVHVVDRRIAGLARSYGEAAVGTLVAIIGSSGRLEIAQVGGAADVRLGLGVGDEVWVRHKRA